MCSKGPFLTIDKTPSYIRSFGVAAAAHRLFGRRGVKIVALLRNPSVRLYSQFKMERMLSEKPQEASFPSFDQYIQGHLDELRHRKLTQAPDLQEYQDIRSRQGKCEHMFALPTNRYTMGNFRGLRQNSLFIGMYAPQLAEWLKYFELRKTIHIASFTMKNWK